MKFVLTLCCYILSFSLLYSQSEKIEALTKEGLALHDNGDYTGAIEKYKKVLVYDPTSDLMNYEIAFSYAQSKNYPKAIEHCNTVINGKGQSVILALILKGSCLDDLGAKKAADTFYKKALKQYPNQYLLLLNYGIRCNKLSLAGEAEKSFLHALELKPAHPGTHLSMAYLQLNHGERMRGLL
jgi:tetratricopeptide (TPR) repeat protein